MRLNLRRRGVIPEEASTLCLLCEVEEESVDHLFYKCRFTGVVWNFFLSLFGSSWVFGSRVENLLVAWLGTPLKGRLRVAWKMVPFAVFWEIWKERNRRIF